MIAPRYGLSATNAVAHAMGVDVGSTINRHQPFRKAFARMSSPTTWRNDVALLATLHDHQRAKERQSLEAEATLRVGGRPIDALIANISGSGCLFVCAEPLAIGDTVSIGIAGVGRRQSRIVRAEGSRFGAAFETPLLRSEIDAALAVAGDTVVSFPSPIGGRPEDDLSPTISGFSPAARLGMVAALAVATWGAVIAVLHVVA